MLVWRNCDGSCLSGTRATMATMATMAIMCTSSSFTLSPTLVHTHPPFTTRRYTWKVVVGSRYDPCAIEVARRDTDETACMGLEELVAAVEAESDCSVL
jgi:hypothetical protein